MSLTINGITMQSAKLTAGYTGAWYLDFQIDSRDNDLSLRVGTSVVIAYDTQLELRGTIATLGTTATGTSTGRVVGGQNRWAYVLPAKSYVNDAGISTSQIIQDLLSETGESASSIVAFGNRQTKHYIRPRGTASTTLESILGPYGLIWRVGYDGQTQILDPIVEAQSQEPVSSDLYAVSDFALESGVLKIHLKNSGFEAIDKLRVGARIDLDSSSLIVRDLVVSLDAGGNTDLTVWATESLSDTPTTTESRLFSVFSRLVRHSANAEKLYGVYKYRIVRSIGEKAELHPLTNDDDLPKIKAIPQYYGLPGSASKPKLGSICLVGFIAGNRTEPYIQSYECLLSPSELGIGGAYADGQPAAREGDTVRVTLPTANFSGTISGAPASGTLTWTDPYADGEITSGSNIVRIK